MNVTNPSHEILYRLSVDAMLVMSRVSKGYPDSRIKRDLDLLDNRFAECVEEICRIFQLNALAPDERRERMKQIYLLHRKTFGSPEGPKASDAGSGSSLDIAASATPGQA